jgi:hypothetical protein
VEAWQFNSLDNPLLDPEEVEEARRTTDPRTFRQEWEASFEALKGRAYYAFDRKVHVGDVALEPSLPVCVSFDFNINPATAVICQARHGEVRVWREVFLTHEGGEATRAAATASARLLAGCQAGRVRCGSTAIHRGSQARRQGRAITP